MFFYWAHDLYRMIKEEADYNIDGFMYQITLSITEYLSDGENPKKRIRKFTKHFSPETCKTLNKVIIAHLPKKTEQLKLEFWEILYDMRNDFIHEASWFNIPNNKSTTRAFISSSKHRIFNSEKKNIEYIIEVRIKFQEYLEYFWEAYLDYFGYKKSILMYSSKKTQEA